MEFRDEIFDGDPLEHLVKILQNASPQAIKNSIESLFEEYAILSLAIEEKLDHNARNIKEKYENEIKMARQDLAIRLMSDILSQE